ncbi:MAG: cation:proton antiporter [Gammaproteobacteria bacterium]|nr:MAG: cation:proton antiporter [Gammaproteobacteria bacterium]
MPVSETVLILMYLLGAGVFVAGVFRKLPIPYTVVLVIIGIFLNYLATQFTLFQPLQQLTLTPELVFFIFLPILIFESGFSLDARQLIKDIMPVLTLAIPALLISSSAIGIGLWLIMPVDLIIALLFGALISATDPVAVISLFKELGTPKRLTILVEGESLMNDATAIVVFTILLGIALHGNFAASDLWHAVGEFFKVFLGGALVGVVFAFIVVWFLSVFHISFNAIMMLSMILAYVSFITAEHYLHVSGVMAAIGAAVVLGIFGMPRLPRMASNVLNESWGFLGLMANTLLFILVGLSVDITSLAKSTGLILIAVLLVQGVRAAIIYSMVPFATSIFKLPRITLGERHIMWWGGLKGGLAFAIVLSIPESLPERQLLLDLTVGVVLFSLLVNAPTIKPLMRWLGMHRLTEDENTELQHAVGSAKTEADDILQELVDNRILSKEEHQDVNTGMNNLFDEISSEVQPDLDARYLQLNALRAEMKRLDEIYSAGVITQYTYLDIKGELQRKRDHIVSKRQATTEYYHVLNPFIRLEATIIKRLREHDWAAGILAQYQKIRFSQHLIKDIVRVLMVDSALGFITNENDIAPSIRGDIEAHYQKRMKMYYENINEIRNSFPSFYQQFVRQISTRTSLVSALKSIEENYHSGSIGAKVFREIEQHLHLALRSIPNVAAPYCHLSPADLLNKVPLFSGLPEDAINGILEHTTYQDFLPGDTIIGEQEHGDALYIIVRGTVIITHGKKHKDETVIAELGEGDFIGEKGLFGEHVRMANVRSKSTCTLMRLTRSEILSVASKYPAVSQRLESAIQSR